MGGVSLRGSYVETLLTCRSLVTEWRIVKRVDEQFNAFIAGFHELIPADLVNVFDERELELLIGGISEIDVDDWVKNTDYRGYEEKDPVIQNFWKASLNEPLTHLTTTDVRFSSFGPGTLSKSHVFCNLRRVLRVFPSTDLRIFKAVTDQDGSPSKRHKTSLLYRRVILASTG